MIKVLELFAGIGACSKALTNLKIEHEIVDAVEIDKYAIESFNAIHGTDFKPQDITKWDKDIECDLIMHGSPCQDFSVAGKGAGGDKGSGTRSSLMYETIRIVDKLRPKYVIWENVKNLLSEKHRPNFEAYQKAIADLGYKNFVSVLNAKDYGIPQNRERVFTVSIRRDDGDPTYTFPKGRKLRKTLSSLLDETVDSKYYISDDKLKNVKIVTPKISKTIRAGGRGSLDRHTWDVVRVGGLYDKNGSKHQAGSIYDPRGIVGTLSTMQGGNQEPIVVYPKPKVRRLTPKECWRLMGFSDGDFRKARKKNSDTQLYKQAGNSICVAVLEAILRNLL